MRKVIDKSCLPFYHFLFLLFAQHVSIIETIHQELTANGNKYNVTGELINLRIMDYLTKLRKDMELWMRVAPKDSIVHGYTPVHLDCAAGKSYNKSYDRMISAC